MTFDFTNYTFSGLMSVLAALYGVGYPLIIQSIERIYSQYDSSLLANRFIKEPIYRLFQALLVINLAFAVCCPFLLHANWCNNLLLTIQAVLLVILMGCTFMLFQLMIKYGNAGKLLSHIRGLRIDGSNVMEILDLAIYADSKNNPGLFYDCMSDVFAYFYVQQGDRYDEVDKNKVLPPVVYDNTSVSILNKIKNFIREDDGHHLLYRNADVVSILYNQLSNSRVDITTHQRVWSLLNEAITNGNHSWFKQYWQFADSFASIKYRFVSTDELRKDKKYFMLRNVMVGALLLHSDKLRWMNDVFFYTHSDPEYYGMIPSSFEEIILMLENIDSVCADNTFMEHNFYFADEMAGVKDNRYVFREAVRYLSLLVIRLWSMETRRLDFRGSVFDIPLPPVLLSDDERASDLMVMMKTDIEDFYKKGVFDSISRMSKVDIEKPLALLESYKQKCENAKEYHIEHPIVDETKFEIVKREALEFAENFSHNLHVFSSLDRSRTSVEHTQIVTSQEQLSTINYSPYTDIGIDFHTVWTNLKFEIGKYYNQILFTGPILANYNVPRDQIQVFLEEIGYSSEHYSILATEAFEEIEGCVNMEAQYWPACIYIMRAEDVPIISIEAVEEGKLHPLIEGSMISSNLIHFRECTTQSFVLVAASMISVSTYADAKGIIAVRIEDDYRSQGLHVNVPTTLDGLFHANAE